MKKLVLVIAIACLVTGAVFAQNWGNGWNSVQPITINGTLQLQNGVIAVASGSSVYFVPTLTQYIGFIEGLREGAQISLEGIASGNYIQPSKVTISGRTYDFTNNAPGVANNGWGWGRNRGSGWGMMGRQIGGFCCW